VRIKVGFLVPYQIWNEKKQVGKEFAVVITDFIFKKDV